MRMLRDNGYEVHYASMGEEEILDCDKSFTVPFTRSPFKLSNVQAYKQLKKIVDRENYDIIHTHTPMGSVVTRLAARDARRRGTRVIYTAHGFHFFTGAPLLNWMIYYPVEKWMARYTDTLITINNEDYERAKRQFKTDVQHVPGVGVDESKFKPRLSKNQRDELRASLGIKPGDFVMIYPAELSKRKRQLWLINTLAELLRNQSDMHLLLPGGDSLSGRCQALVSRLGLESQIHFLGYRSDIPQLIMSANLAVSSSSQEGLPVNLLEALVAGLPIVATDCRGTRDVTKHAEHVVVVDKNGVVDFIRAIRAMKKMQSSKALAEESLQLPFLLDHILPYMQSIYFKKLRVLHLLASNKFSGAESVAVSLIDQTSNNFDAVYCSPAGPVDKILKSRSITKIDLDTFSPAGFKKVLDIWRPDIIHAHDFKASLLASRFYKGAKVISHIHQNPAWLNNEVNPKSLIYRIVSYRFLSIVVVSRAIKSTVTMKRVKNASVTVVYNPLDVNRISSLRSEYITEPYDLVFCGRLEKVKQPLDFIAITKRISETFPSVRAVMVGDGVLRDSCIEEIKRLGLQENVTLVGFKENPYPYIANSVALIITSKDEGFGLVALEAMILGTEVFSYQLDAVKEVLHQKGSYGYGVDELAILYTTTRKAHSIIEKTNFRELALEESEDSIRRIESLYSPGVRSL